MNMRCNVAVQVAVLLGTACAALTPQLRAQTLVWEDNFNGPAIDGNTWTYDVGNGCQIGLCGATARCSTTPAGPRTRASKTGGW